MSDDLRTLAQAVVDAPPRSRAMYLAISAAGFTREDCVRILAALDAAEAQGYARAMGEVVERCEGEAAAFGTGRTSDHYARALDAVADWARERPAAAEKEHGG